MILENFEIALVLLRQFQNFQKCTRTIYPWSLSQTCDKNWLICLNSLNVRCKIWWRSLKDFFKGTFREKIFKTSILENSSEQLLLLILLFLTHLCSGSRTFMKTTKAFKEFSYVKQRECMKNPAIIFNWIKFLIFEASKKIINSLQWHLVSAQKGVRKNRRTEEIFEEFIFSKYWSDIFR